MSEGTSVGRGVDVEQRREEQEDRELDRKIKGIFDPSNILNPGKIFP